MKHFALIARRSNLNNFFSVPLRPLSPVQPSVPSTALCLLDGPLSLYDTCYFSRFPKWCCVSLFRETRLVQTGHFREIAKQRNDRPCFTKLWKAFRETLRETFRKTVKNPNCNFCVLTMVQSVLLMFFCGENGLGGWDWLRSEDSWFQGNKLCTLRMVLW